MYKKELNRITGLFVGFIIALIGFVLFLGAFIFKQKALFTLATVFIIIGMIIIGIFKMFSKTSLTTSTKSNTTRNDYSMDLLEEDNEDYPSDMDIITSALANIKHDNEGKNE